MSIANTLKTILFGDPNAKQLSALQPIVDQINALEPEFEALDDEALKAKTGLFKTRLAAGESLEDLLPEAYATVREASKRTLGMRHFDVQLMGGIVLHQGSISEMKTGEGKTLVSTLPAYLNALEGQGVYLVTVNDYLAKRDSEWMGTIHRYLGLTVGLIQNDMGPEERLVAYACDITYGTNNEFGFDYLRDNMAWDPERVTQKRRHYAIIDEVDSILIDEARTPLIISGPVQDSPETYRKIFGVVKPLEVKTHFTVEEKHKNIVLTEAGIEAIESSMGLSDIYSVENMDVAHIAVQCLKAKHLYQKDVTYVVQNDEVQIVDEFTGRILEGRRFSDGLHQSIEAKENVPIKEESQTLASITFQNYFRMFPKLSGMTGTAFTEAEEFLSIYGLGVVSIPTNKPLARKDQPDLVYKSKAHKHSAIVEEVARVHKTGQPILVGTISIETSEELSHLLKQKKIVHHVLNAKFHSQEAEIITGAGQKGAVTIATNMAGRGTDIVLGDGVKELGGLYVLGSSRHESRRIDNQLRGRAGRQGDPGESRFYVALDDELMRLFGSERIIRVMETLNMPEDEAIEHSMISKSIERAQTKVEKYYYGMRKQILQYDDVMNRQRLTLYALREQVLMGRQLTEKVLEIHRTYIDRLLTSCFGSEKEIDRVDADVKELFWTQLKAVFPIKNLEENLPDELSKWTDELAKRCQQIYETKRSSVPEGLFDQAVTARVLLMAIDKKWMEHLHSMDSLREGIGLRAYGQRDPLIEYKREGFDMFQEMMMTIYEETLQLIARAELVVSDDKEAHDIEAKPVESPLPTQMAYSSAKSGEKPSQKTSQQTSQKAASSSADTVGRNDPCPCGSGKKYKKCCMG